MPNATRPRISVINDNPDFLDLMSAILDEDAGYEVTLVKGETASITEIADSKPDLLIVDLLLGGASGWEIVALSRAHPQLADVPIIICSADVIALRDREDEMKQIADLHVLAKPFGIDELTKLVERIIGVPVTGQTHFAMADESIITPVQLQRTQIDADRELLRDEDLLNEEHLRRMDQVLLRRNLDHARMFSRKLSLELQQYVHLYTPEANEFRRRIEKYLVMERMIEREMARRHTY